MPNKLATKQGRGKAFSAVLHEMDMTDSSDQDRVLWTLTEHGGSVGKSDLARRTQMRLNKLDVVLQELERAGKVKLTEARGKLIVGLSDSR